MNDQTNHASNTDDNVFIIPEVASCLKMSKSKISSLVSVEKIPHIRIMESDLIPWLVSQKLFPQ